MKHILFVLVFLIGCSSTEQYSTTTSPLINKSLELCMLNDGVHHIYNGTYIIEYKKCGRGCYEQIPTGKYFHIGHAVCNNGAKFDVKIVTDKEWKQI